ncbi:hypothetical protein LEN26_017994 [Aphanomyces euteiches]|nr:hypothetical protein LEN26_017994 [Aphanomyces euteiches]KAH9106532.1 hypothetical protein AeMF1_017878 [Aphanomyces euteiches]KAH9185186.1 hypothetical protein AeNC1_012838 [Aphanomyces euteiches]
MGKVRPVPSIHSAPSLAYFNKFSIIYSTFFVLKLTTTPLLAYITEPLPWSIPRQTFGYWDSFQEFNVGTFSNLEIVYQQHILPGNYPITFYDSSHAMFFLRFDKILPSNIPSEDALSLLVRFPGAILYGNGMSNFVDTFLSQNVSERNGRADLFQCEYVRYFGFPLDDTCIWIIPLAEPNEYSVFYGKVIWENFTWCWFKLIFRCLLTTYIAFVLYKRYYAHYKSLVVDLETIGVDSKFNQYEIIVGDPTCLILSDPFVTFIMLVDGWFGGAYIGMSIVRVSQFEDLWAFALGCFYTSRFVWVGFFAMKLLSVFVKRYQLEATFAPVDPGLMSLTATLYAGPIFSLVGQTKFMNFKTALSTLLQV